MFEDFEVETTTITETETETAETTTQTPYPTITKLDATRALYRAALVEEVIKRNANPQTSEINSRSKDAVALNTLGAIKALIVGGGGIGSSTARDLVGMGVRNLSVIDFDKVEIQNVGTQFHKMPDIGMTKVMALHDSIMEMYYTSINTINAKVEDLAHIQELTHYTKLDILIGAVDNMGVRNKIGHDILDYYYRYLDGMEDGKISSDILPAFYIDARMSLGLWNIFVLPLRPEFLNVLSTPTIENMMATYEKHALFTPEEGMQEPCTARALGYTGENIASYIAALVDTICRKMFRPANTEHANALKEFFTMSIARSDNMPLRWVESFNARDFKSLNRDVQKELLRDKWLMAVTTAARLQEANETMLSAVKAVESSLKKRSDALVIKLDAEGQVGYPNPLILMHEGMIVRGGTLVLYKSEGEYHTAKVQKVDTQLSRLTIAHPDPNDPCIMPLASYSNFYWGGPYDEIKLSRISLHRSIDELYILSVPEGVEERIEEEAEELDKALDPTPTPTPPVTQITTQVNVWNDLEIPEGSIVKIRGNVQGEVFLDANGEVTVGTTRTNTFKRYVTQEAFVEDILAIMYLAEKRI